MLIAIHKPYGVLSQFTVEVEGQKTLALYDLPSSVYPIGRLDKDSEGLLLLSDEKPLTKALLEPQNKVEKVYWVQVEGTPTEAQLATLRSGVQIRIKKRDYFTVPAKAKLIPEELWSAIPDRDPPIRVRKTVPDTWISLSITEGKNRQVRKMCAAVGLPVLRLIRKAVGPYSIKGLKAGKWEIIK